MDDGKPDIIAGIRELRAKAAEQLTGNEYYMIVQQLDSLAESAELSGDAASSVFSLIRARLESGTAAASVPGGPEIPPAPDTPAQPDAPSTPEQPVVPDSPAQPDIAPGPEIPSPPDSPAEPPPPPPEIRAFSGAAGAQERVQIITPSANSFGTPQATVAIRHPEPAETPAQEAAPPSQAAGGLISAVLAARTLIEERLSGNSYYAAANLLGQLQIMPPVAGSGETAPPEGFVGALALLRREAAHLTETAREEAAQIIAALENVLLPQAEPLTEKPAAPEPLAPEPDPGPRTGFDDLAEAAWRRVQQVSAADTKRAATLNGSTPPAPAAEAKAPAAPAPVADAPAEMMQQDNGEAFDDGGSESRSSEPCYLDEFEPADGRLGTSDRQEPAAEAGSGAPSEAEREAAVSAEAAALIPLAEPSTLASMTVEAAPGAPDFDAEPEQAVPSENTNVAAADPQPVDPENVAPPDERASAKAEPAGSEAQLAAVPGEPALSASDETPPVQASPPKPARRGLFGRLLGGATSESR